MIKKLRLLCKSNTLRYRNKCFTILELLIVITILLILIALLLPVLHKVKRKTKNTLCVSNMRQSALAILSYAKNNNNYYPRRSVDSSYWSTRELIRYNNSDDRTLLEDYVDNWKVMNCSFTEPSHQAVKDSNSSNIHFSYEMYFGSYIRTYAPESGLLKIGDTATYNNNDFSILIADHDLVRKGRYWRSAHPDYSPQILTYKSVDTDNLFCVRWRIAEGNVRSYVDRSFLRDDGSVFSLTELEPADDRLVELSSTSTKVNDDKVYLPAD